MNICQVDYTKAFQIIFTNFRFLIVVTVVTVVVQFQLKKCTKLKCETDRTSC